MGSGQEEVSVRRALLLALGEYDGDRLPPGEREALVPRLLDLYRDDPDPGLHGAAGWLLNQWGQQGKLAEIDRGLATGKVAGPRRWYVTGGGQTMMLVPPGEFWMGEMKERQRRRIGRGFALAAREVTVAEFRLFREKHQYMKEYAHTEDCPVTGVSWYDAAAYCNWLSKEEGIPREQWCYEPVAAKDVKGEDDFSEEKYKAGMKTRPNALSLSGYRLPAEAEWECACRAGSVTRWSMGEGEDLLGKYAWYAGNSPSQSRPVGGPRPNDLGLFDMHGNAWEWCGDAFGGGRKEDIEEIMDNKSFRSLRGGAFVNTPLYVRYSGRSGDGPANRIIDDGFRPARTFR